jgi:hypothetical protein
MPTFIRPSRVIVEEGGGGLAVVALIPAAIAASAIAAVLDDIVIALAIVAAAAVLGSLAVLVYVLHRARGTVTARAELLAGRPDAVTAAAARPAIEARMVVPGVVLSKREEIGR